MNIILFISPLLILLLTSDASLIDKIRDCYKNVTIASKFYTVLDRTFDTKVRGVEYKIGASGVLQIHDKFLDGYVHIIDNTLTLENGRILDYDVDECSNSNCKSQEIPGDADNGRCTRPVKNRVRFNCSDQVMYERTYYAGPASELTFNNETKFIVFSKRNKQYAFEFDENFGRCGRKVWTIKNHEILAYENEQEECYEDKHLSDYEQSSKELLSQLTCS